MNKFERIRLIKALGLNTEEDILITSEEDWVRQSRWLNRFDAYTVRAFRQDGVTGTDPYFAVIGREDFEPHRRDWLDRGLMLIIAEPVDPQYAEFAGTILRDGELTEVQIARGPGATVRRVTHEGYIDDTYVVRDRGKSTGDPKVDEALRKVHEVEDRYPHLSSLSHVIYEFSYYRTKVGYRKEHAIFWEITGIDRMDPGVTPAELSTAR
jgi:hypothetical protein